MFKRIPTARMLFLASLVALIGCSQENSPAPREAGGAGDAVHPVNAKPTIACSRCHTRPETVQYPAPAPSPSPGHFAPQECSDCHQSLGAVPEFTFNHLNTEGNFGATCLPCHEPRRPPGHNPGLDCARCHRQPQLGWQASSGNPHPDLNAQLTSCSSCHTANRPASTTLPSGTLTGHFGNEDCAGCHDPKGSNITEFQYTHSVKGQAVSTCVRCHSAQRPATAVGRFSHAIAGTGECGSCHKNPGITWSGATYNHTPAPAACAGCHLTDRPELTLEYSTSRGAFTHGRASHDEFDCRRCHMAETGRTWVISEPANTCSRCHGGSGPIDD